MAERLYALGHWASRHVWPVIIAWLMVVASFGGAAATFSKPLSTEFTIPGTEFQEVMDQLKEGVPDAAGGVGTVVFESESGEFTADQRTAINEVVKDFATAEGVTAAESPFALQKEIDDAPKELKQAREELESGRTQMENGREELESGKKELAQGREQLEQAQKELDAGKQELQSGRTELKQQREQVEQLRAQLGPDHPRVQQAEAGLQRGQQQLEQAEAELEAGTKRLSSEREKLEAGEQEIATNEKKLADSQKELTSGEADLQRGQAQQELTDGMRFVAEGGGVAYTQIRFADEMHNVAIEDREAVMAKAEGLSDQGITTTFSEEMSQDTSSIIGPGEIIGVVVAAIVLLVMLRSLTAAGLPLVNALLGVAVGVAGALSLTPFISMQDITPVLAVMLGLAVGIDYTLFIVHRHRTQMVTGMDKHESIGLAIGTAGNAVGVAGATVFIALAALTLTGIPFLGTMGLVAAATVLIAVLVAWTLSPALLSLLGDRVLGKSGRAKRARALEQEQAGTQGRALSSEREQELRAGSRPRGGATSFFNPPATAQHAGTSSEPGGGTSVQHEAADEDHPFWARLVTRVPWLTVLAVVLGLGALAWPVTDMRLGMPDGSTAPADSQGYQTFDTIRTHFGDGVNGPLVAMAEAPEGLSEGEAADRQIAIAQELHATEGVEYVVPAGMSEDRSMLAFQITPSTAPGDEATLDLVHRLRDKAPGIESAQDVELGFTGLTVANIDISEALASTLPLYLAVVVGLSLLLLVLVFRSIVVPLVATAGFLLSVGASFGAVVAVYQWGWLGSLFGVNEPGAILSFLPTLVIGVLFGLAMDYQMFLVSGMREAWAHGASARKAVQRGFGAGASVVTAAALIMVSVFAGFIHAELTMIRPIGLALALGVLVDAFVVRMTFTPAVLHLLGEKAWWIPRWLDRMLPDLDVEGAKLQKAHGVDAEGHHTPAEPAPATAR